MPIATHGQRCCSLCLAYHMLLCNVQHAVKQRPACTVAHVQSLVSRVAKSGNALAGAATGEPATASPGRPMSGTGCVKIASTTLSYLSRLRITARSQAPMRSGKARHRLPAAASRKCIWSILGHTIKSETRQEVMELLEGRRSWIAVRPVRQGAQKICELLIPHGWGHKLAAQQLTGSGPLAGVRRHHLPN